MKLKETELHRLSQLIERALDLPESERSQFIASHSGADPEIEGLLRDGMRAMGASFLSPVTPDRRAEAVEEKRQANTSLESQSENRPGDRVGPYQLVRPIGSGGMGSVWLAERVDGALQRQVALKLPRFDLDRRHAEEMLRERDILASLEHPNIARLYDAGVTDTGHPFLAMEYVDGRRIDHYFGTETPSVEAMRAFSRHRTLGTSAERSRHGPATLEAHVEARLRAFLEVARTVAFAHRG